MPTVMQRMFGKSTDDGDDDEPSTPSSFHSDRQSAELTYESHHEYGYG